MGAVSRSDASGSLKAGSSELDMAAWDVAAREITTFQPAWALAARRFALPSQHAQQQQEGGGGGAVNRSKREARSIWSAGGAVPQLIATLPLHGVCLNPVFSLPGCQATWPLAATSSSGSLSCERPLVSSRPQGCAGLSCAHRQIISGARQCVLLRRSGSRSPASPFLEARQRCVCLPEVLARLGAPVEDGAVPAAVSRPLSSCLTERAYAPAL